MKNSPRRITIIKAIEIRQSYIDFFKEREHTHLPSSSVIPFDDPTIMFANAGMNQFKDIFTGRRKAEFPRAVTVQKCMRAGGKHNDLHNVGRTQRHHTFFEMLGNFSFGDYFKEEAIVYAWEWITKYLQLPAEKLSVSVYEEDDKAFALWEKVAPKLKNGRILRFGRKDNYWAMGDIGPCGPCSEIHYDRGSSFGTGPDDIVNGEGDRFVEFWNLVFMQFERKADGTIEPLPKPSVDTGAGLERIACILADADSNYETDLFLPIINKIAGLSKKKYYSDQRGVSHRVIADHIRALTFCLGDGGGMSNEKAGYVLRRILRRASRHGRLLEIHEPFMYRLVPTLVDMMGSVYPEIVKCREHIENVIRSEEESFGRTLDTGCDLFDKLAEKAKESGVTEIPGKDVFKMYDTYGFPVDLVGIMAEEKGLTLDLDGFDRAMKQQKEQSKGAAKFDYGEQMVFVSIIERHFANKSDIGQTDFIADKAEVNTTLIYDSISLHKGKTGYIGLVPNETPIYVEAGGQVSDHGYIEFDNDRLTITLVIKYKNIIVHICEMKGHLELKSGHFVKIKREKDYRDDIMRNHTATHLLHKSLRDVLGEHVYQSGSYVGPDKLRFDFSHFQPMTPEQIAEVEKSVNQKILDNIMVHTDEDVEIEEARKSGAMAIFGEKYGSKVRVVSIEDYSKELCGGTHVKRTSQIGPFLITLETGIASGVRRIEAVTGKEAIARMLADKETVERISHLLNRPIDKIADAVNDLHHKYLEAQKEIKKLKEQRFAGGAAPEAKKEEFDNFTLYYNDFGNTEPDEMSGWLDYQKTQDIRSVCIATGWVDGKRTFMASTADPMGVDVGKLSKELLKEVGGRGGGKPNFARGSIPDDVTYNELIDKLKRRQNKKDEGE